MLKGMFAAFGTLFLVIVILYLTFVCTKYIGRGTRLRNVSHYMKITDQLVLGQDRSIAIVEIGSRLFLIGIAASQITILEELQKEDMSPLEEPEKMTAKVPDFKELLEKFGNRKKN